MTASDVSEEDVETKMQVAGTEPASAMARVCIAQRAELNSEHPISVAAFDDDEIRIDAGDGDVTLILSKASALRIAEAIQKLTASRPGPAGGASTAAALSAVSQDGKLREALERMRKDRDDLLESLRSMPTMLEDQREYASRPPLGPWSAEDLEALRVAARAETDPLKQRGLRLAVRNLPSKADIEWARSVAARAALSQVKEN